MPHFESNFEWDPKKTAANFRKHGITFERAATVFLDPDALSLYDRTHSQGEDRWITLGMDSHGRLLVISHTWRDVEGSASRCRIISARKATNAEARQYRSR
jgi:uncharacterized protein